MDCSFLKLYDPEPICFSQDGKGMMNGVEVIDIEGCDFTGPGAGVIEDVKDRVVPEAFPPLKVNTTKDLEDLIVVEEAYEWFLSSFLGDMEYPSR